MASTPRGAATGGSSATNYRKIQEQISNLKMERGAFSLAERIQKDLNLALSLDISATDLLELESVGAALGRKVIAARNAINRSKNKVDDAVGNLNTMADDDKLQSTYTSREVYGVSDVNDELTSLHADITGSGFDDFSEFDSLSDADACYATSKENQATAKKQLKKINSEIPNLKALSRTYLSLHNTTDYLATRLSVLEEGVGDPIPSTEMELDKDNVTLVQVDLRNGTHKFPSTFDKFDTKPKTCVDTKGHTQRVEESDDGVLSIAGHRIGVNEVTGDNKFNVTIDKYDDLASELQDLMPLSIVFDIAGEDTKTAVHHKKTYTLKLEKPEVNAAQLDGYYSDIESATNGKLREHFAAAYDEVAKKTLESAANDVDDRFAALDATDKQFFADLLNGNIRDEEYTYINGIRSKANWTKGAVIFPVDSTSEGKLANTSISHTDWNMLNYFKQEVLADLADDDFRGSEDDFKKAIKEKLADKDYVDAIIKKGIAVAGQSHPLAEIPGGGTLPHGPACHTSFQNSVTNFLDHKETLWEEMRKGWYTEKVDQTSHQAKLEDIFNQHITSAQKDAFWMWVKTQTDEHGQPIYDVKDDTKRTPQVRDLAFQLLVGEYNPSDEDNATYAPRYEYRDTTGAMVGVTDPSDGSFASLKNAFVQKKDAFVGAFIDSICKDSSIRTIEKLNSKVSEELDTHATETIKKNIQSKLATKATNIIPHLANFRDHVVHNKDRRETVPVYSFNKNDATGDMDAVDVAKVSMEVNLVDVKDFYEANPEFKRKVRKKIGRIKEDEGFFKKIGRWFSRSGSKKLKDKAEKQVINSAHMADETQAMAQRAAEEVEMGLVDRSQVHVETDGSLKEKLQDAFNKFYATGGANEGDFYFEIQQIMNENRIDQNLTAAAKSIVDKTHEKWQFITPISSHLSKVRELLKNDPQKKNKETNEAIEKFKEEAKKLDMEYRKNHHGNPPSILTGILGESIEAYNTDNYMKLLKHREKVVQIKNSTQIEISNLRIVRGDQVRSADSINRKEGGGLEKKPVEKIAEFFENHPGMRVLGFVGAVSAFNALAGPTLGWKMAFGPLLAGMCAFFESKGWFTKEIKDLNTKIAKKTPAERESFFKRLQEGSASWAEKYAVAMKHQAKTFTDSLVSYASDPQISRGASWTAKRADMQQTIAHAYSMLKFRKENKYRQMMLVKDEKEFNDLHQALKAALSKFNSDDEANGTATRTTWSEVSRWADNQQVLDTSDDERGKISMLEERDDFASAMKKKDRKANTKAFFKALGVGASVGAVTLVAQEALHWFGDMLSGSESSAATNPTTGNNGGGTVVPPNTGGGLTQTVTQLVNPDLHTEMSGLLSPAQYDAFVQAVNDPANSNEYLRNIVHNHVTGGNAAQTNAVVHQISEFLVDDSSTLQEVRNILQVPGSSWFDGMEARGIIAPGQAANMHNLMLQFDANPASLTLAQKTDLMELVYRSNFHYHDLFRAHQLQIPVPGTGVPQLGGGQQSGLLPQPSGSTPTPTTVGGVPVNSTNGVITLGSPQFTTDMQTLLGNQYNDFYTSLTDVTNTNSSLLDVMTDAGLNATQQDQVLMMMAQDPTVMANMQQALNTVINIDNVDWVQLYDNLNTAGLQIHDNAGNLINPANYDNATLQAMFTQFDTNPGVLHDTQIKDVIRIMQDRSLTQATDLGLIDPQSVLPVNFTPNPPAATRGGVISSAASKVGNFLKAGFKKTMNPLITAASWTAGLLPKIGRKRGMSEDLLDAR